MTLVKISRPGWWLPSIWLYVLPTGQQWHLLSSARFWFGLFFVIFPQSLMCFGMNDFSDVEIDKDNSRKGNYMYGAKCTKKELVDAMKICAVMYTSLAIACSCMADDPVIVAVILGAGVLFNVAYNFEPLRLSSKCPFEFPCVIGGFYCVALFSCYFNSVPVAPLRFWVHTACIITRTQLWTEYMDVDEDAEKHRRTTAVVLGKTLALVASGLAIVAEFIIAFTMFQDAVIQIFSCVSFVMFLAMEVVKPILWDDNSLECEKQRDTLLNGQNGVYHAKPTVKTSTDARSTSQAAIMVGMSSIGIACMVYFWMNGVFVDAS